MRVFTSDLVHSASHLFCSQIFWHRADSVPSTPLFISSEGMSSIPRYLLVSTAGSTSPSVPADYPHFQWNTSWFVVWSRQCRVSSQLYMSQQYPAHLLRIPSLSVISLLSLLSMTAALCYLVLVTSLVCHRTLCCFLLSFLSSWHHIAPLSNSLWLISTSSWPRYAMLVLLITSSYIGLSASSVLVSHRIGPTSRS